MKLTMAVIVLVALTGCASIKITPPVENEQKSKMTYDKPFEETWIKAVDWFAEHNVVIDKIEKQSGLLTAKHRLKTADSFLNCGDINATGLLRPPVIDKFGMLNVTVREKTANTSRVTINFFGEFTLEGNDAWDARLVTAKGHCISTGEIEKSFFAYIANDK